MSLEDLKQKFIVDEDVHRSRLESLLEIALSMCVVDKNGIVHISATDVSTTDKVMLVLAARYLASQLEASISADVKFTELEKSTGMDPKQVGARLSDVVKNRLATSPQRGVYRVVPHRIEGFLQQLTKKKK